MSITMVQPRLVENRVYDYKAYLQTVEDELDRKDTRLVPSRQCLSTVKRPTALLACVFSFHAVTGLSPSPERKMKMKTTPYRKHHQPGTKRRTSVNKPFERDRWERKTIGERDDITLCVSGACPLPVYAYSIAYFMSFVKGF